MPAEYKVLGQASPASTTNVDLYTVPSTTSAVCSTLSVCNRGSTTAFFRVAVRPAGATLANQHYIVYDTLVNPNDSVFLTLGMTLAETDVMTVYSTTSNLSFTLFGATL
jgi:hypothetical protein